MRLSGSVAKRYADAFLKLALESHAVDEWGRALERASEALTRETLRDLAAASIPLHVRSEAVERAFASETAAVRALLRMLLERNRVMLFPAVARAYRDLLDRRAGVEKAVVTTAVPLATDELQELVARLERESGKRLRATVAVDPSLLGGLVFRIGDHQLDGSVRTRLALLREHLASG